MTMAFRQQHARVRPYLIPVNGIRLYGKVGDPYVDNVALHVSHIDG